MIRFTKNTHGNQTNIAAYSADDEYLGEITLERLAGNALGIDDAFVVEQRRKVGTRLYEEALKEACSQGRDLQSDMVRSQLAEAFWRKQHRKGRAKCLPGRGVPVESLRASSVPQWQVDGEGPYWPCRRWSIPFSRCPDTDLSALELAPSWAPWAAGAAALLLLLGAGAASVVKGRWTWGRAAGKDPWGHVVYRDPAGVVPRLADRVELILTRLRARGFDPIVAEGYRTPARAAMLAEGGTGVAMSMHSYGGAVDIVDRTKGWAASEAFKSAVVEEAERLGLFSGRRFSNKDDWAHVQAVPPAKQAAFFAASVATRDSMVA